ncbi:hypothetical protein Tsubulata_041124 [Turnera subulata]|uniref:Uncharacterized protein n=1 Tax=Turnera subulata TaxID=218843 RepID=A0A9Q0FFI1_9ROSI|nr:hypothetical protein Tsubulata_041124 [Turnera subulata]
MASTLTFTSSLPCTIRASSAGSSKKPDPNRRKGASSPAWWAPIFGWSSDPDYIGKNSSNNAGNNPTKADGSDKGGSGMSGSDPEPGRSRSRFAPGCFTEEKAKQLRRKTVEGSAFHDVMYHSAIASRLALDDGSEE